ncbi:glutamine synthetase family protein [Halegenticoccus soli]|uniref:glutamine synthetase family protein n=1 Tax=Halegenticoccus soli TaxID=1985678 RepID=UPI000C6CC033|nr:glutamine synthetase family protein [Halegenticoccus soli]
MTDHGERMRACIDEEGIEHVFVEFADVNGISRSKQIAAEYFIEHWDGGFPMNLLLLVQTPRNDVPQGTGLGEEIDYGDGTVRPDPSTFRVLPWRENAARVLCDFTRDGQPVEAAPRTALKRVIETADVDFDLFVGSELEFYLLDEDYTPCTDHKHECVSWATEEIAPFYDTVTEWCAGYGIDLHSLQHEHGAGQLEILFDYGRPLAQADTTFDFKRLIKQAGRHHDQWATFMAKPFGDRSGSGYHLHVSAFEGGENVFEGAEGELSETGRHFVGGLLAHADALAALGTPTINAFKRYAPEEFAPYTASWGYDNRMTAIRVPPGTVRLENRIASADANPYLVIASTIAAGLHGVEEGLEPEAAVTGDPVGHCPELPRSPTRALRALEADKELSERLGREVTAAYAATKRRELRAFNDHVTDWEREQYVETL